jgi:hypothetical protein
LPDKQVEEYPPCGSDDGPAIDQEILAGDIPGSDAHQEERGLDDVVGGAEPPERSGTVGSSARSATPLGCDH